MIGWLRVVRTGTSAPRRGVPLRPTRSASTTYWGTYGSGRRIAGRSRTSARPMMERRGKAAIAKGAFSAAGRGTTFLRPYAQRSASAAEPRPGTTPLASVSPGRSTDGTADSVHNAAGPSISPVSSNASEAATMTTFTRDPPRSHRCLSADAGRAQDQKSQEQLETVYSFCAGSARPVPSVRDA